MKTSALIAELIAAKCRLKRHGANHDIWENPYNGTQTSVPRHAKEIKKGTCLSILRDLGLR